MNVMELVSEEIWKYWKRKIFINKILINKTFILMFIREQSEGPAL